MVHIPSSSLLAHNAHVKSPRSDQKDSYNDDRQTFKDDHRRHHGCNPHTVGKRIDNVICVFVCVRACARVCVRVCVRVSGGPTNGTNSGSEGITNKAASKYTLVNISWQYLPTDGRPLRTYPTRTIRRTVDPET